MKQIPLTKNKFTLVDDEDYELVNKYNWYFGAGYARSMEKILMHRLIMKAKKGQMIDHIDGNGLNNQRSNLRFCTHSQNMANKKGFKNTSSKYKGVYTHIDSK